MTYARLAFRIKISPSGDALLRSADGLYPDGYQPHGESWALRLPPDIMAGGGEYDQTAACIGYKSDEAAAAGLVKLREFWEGALAVLLPDLKRTPPISVAGSAPKGSILRQTLQVTDRIEQITAYLSMSRAAGKTYGVPTDISLFLRQLRILAVPSHSQAYIRRQGPGHWTLRFNEAGPLERLLDSATYIPRTDAKEKIHGIAITALRKRNTAKIPAAQLIALVRAVQLAQIWAASWASEMPRLDIEVAHAGLVGESMRLSIRPENWGLPLARLSQLMVAALEGTIMELDWSQITSTGLRPRLQGIDEIADEDWCDPVPGKPVTWQATDADGFPRWTYAGTDVAAAEPYADLPFALFPGALLSEPLRRMYLEWLSGNRREQGFQPEFARLYLQGLEYRLLAERGPQDECDWLVNEMKAVAGLLDKDTLLVDHVRDLLDWLGATGRRKLDPVVTEGPYSVLVITARKAANAEVLGPDDICALARICLDDDSQLSDTVLKTLEAAYADGMQVRPPRVELRGSYRSISGLLDEDWRPFMHEDQPLADLRASGQLRHAIARAQAACLDAQS